MTDWDTPIKQFWAERDAQTLRQQATGRVDAGTRGAVTGGRHLMPLTETIADLFRNTPGIHMDVRTSGRLTLPGYYRPTKNWDIVVRSGSVLVAAIELKSQVGSFGNNVNNRTEEAIGNAIDIRRAYQAGLLGRVPPWLGFVMVMEEARGSTVPLGNPVALFPTDHEFDGTSYLDRYRTLLGRLVEDGIYDAAVAIGSRRGEGVTNSVPDLSFERFEHAVGERIRRLQSLTAHVLNPARDRPRQPVETA